MHNTSILRQIFIAIVSISLVIPNDAIAQSGTEFWFAPPDITDLHNSPGGEPLFLFLSSTGQPATVTIEQPANPSFNGGAPIVVSVAANKSTRVNLTSLKTALETRPTNAVLNTGLRISSTSTITCYYECANNNNTDIWALKGPNGLGTEFYIPLHKHNPFQNFLFSAPHPAFASFDICATDNNTVVTIYSPTQVDGFPALQQFSITLNRGQTYSCGWTGTNYTNPATHPSGAIVLSSKPITVSLKDDSNRNPSGGCYDILGDQIVPVDIVGEDYIAVKGSLNNNGDESVVLMATQNNTQVFLNGASTPVATLFAGEYYRIDMDYLTTGPDNSVYIHCTKPTYAMHITGFGCEMGMAQLPPLNCAGSQQLNFVRGNSQAFFLTILCRATAVNGFTVTGPGTATINPSSFVNVPGTGGEWRAARIQYNTTQVPVDSTFRITNSVDVFALGVVNGGATTGCKYGYFSEFVAPIVADAGVNQTICANTTAQLQGTVAGGSTTGIWTSSGTGSFTPNNIALNAVYTPSAADAAVSTVTLTLTSTGACTPVSDQMTLTITPAPTANAGADISVCRNNSNVSLNGSVTVATGGVWTGGTGTYVPGNNILNPVYIPSPTELASGSIVLTFTSTGNGICNPASDNILITFTPAPIVNAGANITRCGNNPAAVLNGSITNAAGGVWTGGTGTFSPSPSTLNATYTPSAAEIANGSITLTLTSTGNGNCNSVSDDITIFYTSPPTVNAGIDQTLCSNNPIAQLNGSFTIATGATWSGGLGLFSPSANAMNAAYTPSAAEIAAGSVTLILTTTGNGNCTAVTDQITISFTPSPTANAGSDILSCANNATVNLIGNVSIASGGTWSGGSGVFSPNANALNAAYTPTLQEIALGSVSLTLTTTGNGSCIPVSDVVNVVISPAPLVNAGLNISACANNASVALNAQVFNATGAIWSGGSGTFTPSNTSLNAVYTPTAQEIANGQVILTLTSTGNGNCIAVSDDVLISFAPAPIVNAGTDQTVCGNNPTVNLSGFVNFAAAGQWSGGLGSFNPGNNSLTATYVANANEIANGFVDLTLTSTGNGSCIAVTDIIRINFTPAPVANAGLSATSCANNPNLLISGTIAVSSGGVWSGGEGDFVPSANSLSATYVPSANEISAGEVTLVLTTTGNGNCLPESDDVVLSIEASPIVSAGLDQTICVNNLNVQLSGSVSGITNTGVWTSSGSGIFIPNNTSLNAIYQCSSADSLVGSVTLTLTTTNQSPCIAVLDQMTIFILPAGIANAGSNQTVCGNNANIVLNGSVSGGASSGVWTTSGTGSFSPSNTVLNATYIPSSFDIANGDVTLTLTANSCNAAEDELSVAITPVRVVNAGNDQTICADQGSIILEGQILGGAPTGIWTTNGTGSFSPSNTALNATYTPSVQDIASQNISFTLTTTNNGSCAPVSDVMTLNIFQIGGVSAGPDQAICSNQNLIQLNGALSGGATQGAWTSSGTGTFAPTSNAPNATYEPSEQDIINGGVTLSFSAINSCNDASDDMVVTILRVREVLAGTDVTICTDVNQVQLEGTIIGTPPTGVWTTSGSGSFSPNASSLNAMYTPSSADIAAQTIELTLTTTNNNLCGPISDVITLNIFPAGGAVAGPDQLICSLDNEVTLSGELTGGATQGVWTSSGTGLFSPNNIEPNAIYTPSEQDLQNGSVVLTFTTTNSCNQESDDMTVTVVPARIVEAGNDVSICSNINTVELNGSVTGSPATGIWTSSGSGTFMPSSSALITNYIPSALDIATGNVILTLSTTNNDLCGVISDQLVLTISEAVSVNVGSDVSICENNPTALISAAISGGSSDIIWNTSGTGLFSPNNLANTSYTASAQDIQNGSVMLVATATQACNVAADTLALSFTQAPTIDAGLDAFICSQNPVFELSASYAISSGISWSGGDGTFSPTNNSPTVFYTPSPTEQIFGEVILTATTTGNGLCLPISDIVTLTMSSGIIINAGTDQVICSSEESAELFASVSNGASSGTWSTLGSGSFVPDNNTLNAIYQFSSSDVTSGSVQLVFTASPEGDCPVVSDTLSITFTDAAQVVVSNDLIVCGTQTVIDISASISGGASQGLWTTNGTGNFENDAALNTTYTITPQDILLGELELVHSTTDHGNCIQGSDTLSVSITAPSAVFAGNDVAVCTTSPQFNLGGSISGASTSGFWTTLGSGSFSPSNDHSVFPVYTLSAADILNGEVNLVLSSSATGICPNTTDTLTISLTTPAITTLGSDFNICASQKEIPLSGIIDSPSEQGVWTADGSGIFTPSNDTLNTVYTPTLNDVVNGQITFVLTSTGNGLCPASSDSLVVFIQPSPVAGFSSLSNEELAVQFTDESINAVLWEWSTENGATSSSQNPFILFPDAGQFSVTLVVTASSGCTDTISSVIQAREKEIEPFAVPTGFSPNDDGNNDVLFVLGGPFKEIDFRIYNNWGNEIFATINPEIGWDGTYKGVDQPGGVYVFTATAVTLEGKKLKLSGNVTLIK